jgi:hypothetical protein
MNRFRYVLRSLPLAVLATSAFAQQRPPIRQLGAVTAASTEKFANVSSVRALANGSILVNDVPGRRVLMFDPALSKFTVVADSTSATANAYGGRIGSLIAYRGDSSIFVDPSSVSMLIIDPAGKVARVVAIPRAQDANTLGTAAGNAAFDAQGRLVYRAALSFGGPGAGGTRTIIAGPGSGTATPAIPQIPEPPDSAFVVRIDLATRKLDTVGVIRTPKIKLETKTDDRGGISISSLINPLPVVDDWVVTSNGSVAFVRGKDYHVDFVNADGSKVSAPKIPFDWQRMTDEDKAAFIDSVKAARERQGANAPTPVIGAPGGGGGGGGGGAPNVQIFIGPGGPGGGPGGGPRPNVGAPQFNFIPASELPDYKPPFFSGAAKADLEGNVWVRTIPTSAIAGGPVYDVINGKGELVDRVQSPVSRTIIGFGPNGAVYLLNRDGATATIEKASVR